MAYPPVERNRAWDLGTKSLSFLLTWKQEYLCLQPKWRSNCQQQMKLEGTGCPAVTEVTDVLLVPINRKPLSLGAPLQLMRWI